MLHLFLLIACDEIRLVSFPSGNDSFKTYQQIKDHVEIVVPEFRSRGSNNKVFRDLNTHNVYQLRKGRDLLSSLFITHEIFIDEFSNKRDVLCIFTVVTAQKHRKNGYAKRLIQDSLKEYINRKRIRNPYIALHLDPEDSMMNFNYAFYYKLGFEKGSICEYGPSSFKMRLNEIEKFKNIRDAMRTSLESIEKGSYFTLFIDYDRLKEREDIDMVEMIKEGEELREILNYRRQNKNV